jgi:hypothetical protein
MCSKQPVEVTTIVVLNILLIAPIIVDESSELEKGYSMVAWLLEEPRPVYLALLLSLQHMDTHLDLLHPFDWSFGFVLQHSLMQHAHFWKHPLLNNVN